MFYHLVSRCVRGAYLCGKSRGRDYSHRRRWLEERIRFLTEAFALEVHAYAIMSNHFHLVVYYDPHAAAIWSTEEVVDRWLSVCPPRKKNGSIDAIKLHVRRQDLLQDPARIDLLRSQLGSQSTFMQLLKQPIARRANAEDDRVGHFFEQRFYSGALLSEEAILAAMAYVDLNPIRARIAETLESSSYTSVAARLRSDDINMPIRPIVTGLANPRFVLKISLADYVARLKRVISTNPVEKSDRWRERVAMIRRKQRAFGTEALLSEWTSERNMQLRELPLPI